MWGRDFQGGGGLTGVKGEGESWCESAQNLLYTSVTL